MADMADAGKAGEPTRSGRPALALDGARGQDRPRRSAPWGVGEPETPGTARQVAGTTGARGGDGADAARLPVGEGEELWTEQELAEVRARLNREIAELRAEIAQAETEIADRLGDAVGGAGDDQADTGAKTFEREHELALTYNARDLLAQNERAIERIDAGTYGLCESCRNPIGKARLQAFPRATLCVRCKQREERR